MNTRFDSTAIVIPAYNAEGTLSSLVLSLRQRFDAASIIVVDDGSTDATRFEAKKSGATVIEHDRNRGKGAALRSGFEYVLGFPKFQNILTMDADLQHRVDDIPAMFETKLRTRAHIVVGMRSRNGSGMPLERKLSNMITSNLVSARTGAEIKDSQCGFRLIDRTVLESVTLQSDGYEAETEFLIKASKKGFRVDFVPIQTVYAGEKSSMTHWKTTVEFIKVLFRDY